MAVALEWALHTIGPWVAAFREVGSTGLAFEQPGGPPALDAAAQARVKAAVQAPPRAVGIEAAHWNWKGVRECVARRFGVRLCRGSRLNSLHRLGFGRKRLAQADAAQREAFGARSCAVP